VPFGKQRSPWSHPRQPSFTVSPPRCQVAPNLSFLTSCCRPLHLQSYSEPHRADRKGGIVTEIVAASFSFPHLWDLLFLGVLLSPFEISSRLSSGQPALENVLFGRPPVDRSPSPCARLPTFFPRSLFHFEVSFPPSGSGGFLKVSVPLLRFPPPADVERYRPSSNGSPPKIPSYDDLLPPAPFFFSWWQ